LRKGLWRTSCRVLQDGNWNLFDVVKYLGPPSPWKIEAIWFVSQSSLVNWKRGVWNKQHEQKLHCWDLRFHTVLNSIFSRKTY
jgi:hypothetical protein